MIDKKRVYWDSCNWIGLINEEDAKVKQLRYVLDKAKNGEVEILTSTFTLAEVFRLKCEKSEKSLPEEKDQLFEQLLDEPFIVYVQVTRDIGIYARKLLRRIDGLKCPQDAIHLASAAFYNVDELHTFDGNHLLPFDGKIERRDGEKLKICEPQFPPAQSNIFVDVLKKETINIDSDKEYLIDKEKDEEKKPRRKFNLD
ncbi:MAG: PIN domain-containing protein [Smithella sp.]